MKPVRPYRGEMTIAQEIEQTQVTLTTAATSLEKAREQQKKPSKNRPSQHTFQFGDFVLVKEHKKKKLELKWEPGYSIVGFPTKWTATARNKEFGEPKHCNIMLYNILLLINHYIGNNTIKHHTRSMSDNRDLTGVFHQKVSSLPMITASDSRYFQSS